MAIQFLNPMVEVGIVTNNIDKMLPFYRDVLGLPLQGKIEYPGGYQYRMSVGDNIIKLAVLTPAPAGAAIPDGPWKATGIRYYSLAVANLREVVEAVRAQGLQIPTEITEINPSFGFAFITDPDGNWIEMFGPI
jgi:catechol 2,3-dioxygenase-like lactoylglutathione lyase family enzyme